MTPKQAQALGKADRKSGMDDEQLITVAEGIRENYGREGVMLSTAYKFGAGIS